MAKDDVFNYARNAHLPAMFETMWATWMLGAVWVPTNFRLSPPEVSFLASSSGGGRACAFDEAFPAQHAAAAAA